MDFADIMYILGLRIHCLKRLKCENTNTTARANLSGSILFFGTFAKKS